MSLSKCLEEVTKVAKLSPASLARIKERAAYLENSYKASRKYGVDPEIIRTQAEADAVRFHFTDLEAQAYKEARNVVAINNVQAFIDKNKSGVHEQTALRATLDPDYSGRTVYTNEVPTNITTLKTVYTGILEGKIHNFIESFRSKYPMGIDVYFTGRKEKIDALVRHVYDKAPASKEITEMAATLKDYFSTGLDMLKQSGLPIKKLDDWNLPFQHNRSALIKADKEQWVKDWMDGLSRDKMLDQYDGHVLDNEELLTLLRNTYDDIVTGGESAQVRNNTVAYKGPRKSLRPDNHRVLFIKDAASWMNLYDKYGTGELFENIIAWGRNVAQEAAVAQIWGPNAKTNFDLLNHAIREKLRQGAIKQPDLLEKVGSFFVSNELLFKAATGLTDQLGNPNFARLVSKLRSYVTSVKLGQAMLSSVNDFGTMAAASDRLGISFGTVLKNYGQLMTEKGRAKARSMGLALDLMIHGNMGAARILDESGVAGSVASRLSSTVLDYSGLSKHTQAAKAGFALALNADIGARANLSFEQLPKTFQYLLKRHNINWDIIRQFVDADGFIKRDSLPYNEQIKFLALLDEESRAAILGPGAWERAFITRSEAPGTIGREAAQTVTQFMSYTLSLTHHWGVKLWYAHPTETKFNTIKQKVAFIGYMTMLGALAIQLKSAAAGKDFRDMGSHRFWADAFFQGGGGLYFADVVNKLMKETGHSQKEVAKDLVSSLGGPTVGTLYGLISTAIIVAQNPISSQKELIQLSHDILPGQNLWYLALPLQRYIFDSLQKELDPKAHKSFNDMNRRLNENTGQKYYWAPGDTKPKRLPTMAKQPAKKEKRK